MENVDLLLINPPFHTRNGGGNFFPLGLAYIISSVVAHGHTWAIIDCAKMIHSFHESELHKFEEKLLFELMQYSPLVIGVGPCITSQLRALKIISKCTRSLFPSIPIVAGGPLASIESQEWVFYDYLGIDYIVKGDGELAIPDAIKAIKDTGNISSSLMLSRRGYSFKNRIADIDSILFPYRELNNSNVFSTRRTHLVPFHSQAAMITARGCPYACYYCVSGNLKTNKKVRKRSINNIIQEIEDLYRNYGVTDIIFYDDCFFSNIKTAKTDIGLFCNALLFKDMHITWQMELRPDLLSSLDDDSVRLLEKSGCRQINIGIEKLSEAGLKFLGKAISLRGLREKIIHIKNISEIVLSATFILGGETETRADINQLINESKNLGLDYAHYNPLFIYPGTPLYKHVFSCDRAWVNIICNDNLPWGEIVFENDTLKRADLLELVNYAYREFYKDTKHHNNQMITDRFNLKERG